MNYLNKNLEILEKVNPSLTKLIKKAECPKQITLYEKQDSLLNLVISKGNQNLLLYEENETEESFLKTLKKSFNLYNDSVTIIVGIGTGHILKLALKEKEKKHIIIVAESIPYLIKVVLERNDFTSYIEKGEVLFGSPGNEEVHSIISMVDSGYVINIWNLLTDPIVYKWPEKYSKMISYICNIINQIQCNVGTVIGAGRLFAENDIKTFANCFLHRGVKELKDLYKNKPAILVSTSPSLQKNIHLLMDEEIRKNYIIIAIAQSLRILLAYNIIPDFITTVDYGIVNIEHFQGLWDSKVPLIALNKTYAPILQKWQGSKFIVGSSLPDFPDTVSGMIAEKGTADQGGSVTHMNFGVAVVMGCNPITTIGLDLGFENDLSHNPNADASGTVKVKDGELLWDVDSPDSSLKGKTHTLGRMHLVDGFWGSPIKTGDGLLSFKTSFETLYQIYKDKFLIMNSTEGGSHIKGSKRIQLKDFMKKYCTIPIDKEILKPLLKSNKKEEKKLIKKALICLDKEMFIFNEIKKNAKKAIEEGRKMMLHYNKHKDKLKKHMELNRVYSTAAEKDAKKNPTLSVAIYYAQREIFSRELNVNGEITHLIKNKKDLKTRCKRNKFILEAATKGCNILLPLYKEEKRKIEEYAEIKDESVFFSPIEDPEVTMDMYNDWLEKKNFAYPIVSIGRKYIDSDEYADIYFKAIDLKDESIKKAKARPDRKNDIKYLDCIEEAFELGKKKKYEKALKVLDKAYKLKTSHKNEKALWGLATTHFLLKNKESSMDCFIELMELCPDNLRYKFEYGCSILHDNLEEGMKFINKVFKETKQFDFFFKTVGDILYSKNQKKEALSAYEYYITQFPDDVSVKEKIEALK